MQDQLTFYIDGAWVPPVKPATREVINPATEKPIARISMGSAADVDKAVTAARRAFETYSRTTREERIALLQKIMAAYQAKFGKPLEVPKTWDDYAQTAQFITDQLAPNVYGAAHFRKCGSPGNPPFAVRFASSPRPSDGNADGNKVASEAEPRPRAPRLKKCLRVIA